MVYALDLRKALFGLQYDVSEDLRKNVNPYKILGSLESRCRKLRHQILNADKYNHGKNIVEDREGFVAEESDASSDHDRVSGDLR